MSRKDVDRVIQEAGQGTITCWSRTDDSTHQNASARILSQQVHTKIQEALIVITKGLPAQSSISWRRAECGMCSLHSMFFAVFVSFVLRCFVSCLGTGLFVTITLLLCELKMF